MHGSAASNLQHTERHRTDRIGWLRAAVLGANDGVVSMSSLLVGVASADMTHSQLFVTGAAALVSGAMSMAAGEYVSVSSQSDTERADLARERGELATDPLHERQELANIYIARGLAPALALQVAEQLMAHDALGAHARDELGLSDALAARPAQAAVYSALSFGAGALVPWLTALFAPQRWLVQLVVLVSLALLASLGTLAARSGGAPAGRAVLRVVLLGALAMALGVGVGKLCGTVP